MPNYTKVATDARKKIIELIFRAQTSHIGSCLSAVDIMAVLFDKADIKKDEIILSAGWKAAAWYYFLWKKGVITEDELNSFCQEGSKFIGLVEPIEGRWGLKTGGGSMGMGICFAVGFALSKKLKGEEGKVYVLMSDGELQCGTTWESALIARQLGLNNLTVIVDNNKYQAMGLTEEILDIGGNLEEHRHDDWGGLNHHFTSLGWLVAVCEGHDYKNISFSLDYYEDERKKDNHFWASAPKIIIAKTIKGKGVSKFEGNNLYHYKNLSEEEYNLALKELNE